jgi:hypothetical protein
MRKKLKYRLNRFRIYLSVFQSQIDDFSVYLT